MIDVEKKRREGLGEYIDFDEGGHSYRGRQPIHGEEGRVVPSRKRAHYYACFANGMETAGSACFV